MKKREFLFIIFFVFVSVLLVIRTVYENRHPLILRGKKARIIAIPSTGRTVESPVSYLFGRAPFFIICDKAKNSYKVLPNKFADAQHAAGLRASRMIAEMKVDAVCGNNVGFEPFRVFQDANIEVYTNIKSTVWETLKAFPSSLTKLNKQNVPAHFGITQSKVPVACSTFNAQANAADIVQGRFSVCASCGYHIKETGAVRGRPAICPKCGLAMHEVIAVTAPTVLRGIKPKIKVF